MALSEILNISFEFSSKIGTRQLPKLDKNYQSNIKGLYIVGDLADAPVIKIALNQGFDVAARMFEKDFGGKVPAQQEGVLDVCIVGAGPSGIGASLACQKHGLSFVVIEREKPFNTIQNYPKNKHVFSEPRDFGNSARFPFQDRIKEDLVKEWEQALDERKIEIRQPEEVASIQKKGDVFEVQSNLGKEKRTTLARRVILAIGRRGSVNKLGVPGEENNPKVMYGLADPDRHRGESVLVVGGGDSAVEAAVALAQAGAKVAISYRQNSFSRCKALNQERIAKLIAEGKIESLLETKIKELTPDVAKIQAKTKEIDYRYDACFALIGTTLPIPFLNRIGVVMEGAFSLQRLIWIVSFALMIYMFYGMKSFKSVPDWAKPYHWPFGPGQPLGDLQSWLKVELGWRGALDGGFWGTVLYSLMITVFAILAIKKYRSPIQTKRYISLMVFQAVFLFGIPELVAPFIIERPWKMYAITVPWPLSIWSLYDADTAWFLVGAATAFVGVPLFVRFHGERFCSWACGCGGLAETLGDRWRHLAPRGKTSKTLERFGVFILGCAAVTTFLILNADIWHFFTSNAWIDAKVFAQQWYGLMVDFWFASVVGVAFYPYLGNRVWCRFICPLRAYMELLSKWFTRIKISANEKCIGCGECTRYCQMGIPVQKFAQMREELSNHNSACIQCGICVEVCPMDVLSVTRADGSVRSETKKKRDLAIVQH
jgi:NosR/NirI family transcriptional regulator, nitrous oxide reductase regulator